MIVTSAFTDEDIASEDKPRRSGYISKKDLTIVLIVALLVIPLVVYFYLNGQDGANNAYCKQNLQRIGLALAGYSLDHDGRMPPTHNIAADGGAALDEVHGLPVTWGTIIEPMMSKQNDFWCRSTKPAEGMTSLAGAEGKTHLKLSYGMYRGLSTVPRDQIQNTGGTLVVAETTNLGASGTYNPSPFGPGRADAFLIGWDDHNLEFSKQTKSVTRLAFTNMATGVPGNNTVGRHQTRINALSAEGSLIRLAPTDALVEHAAPRLKGRWWADPNLYK